MAVLGHGAVPRLIASALEGSQRKMPVAGGLGVLLAERSHGNSQDARISGRIPSTIVIAGALWALLRSVGLGSVVFSHVQLHVAKAMWEGKAHCQPSARLPRRTSVWHPLRCDLEGCLRPGETPLPDG